MQLQWWIFFIYKPADICTFSHGIVLLGYLHALFENTPLSNMRLFTSQNNIKSTLGGTLKPGEPYHTTG